jgi:hypothetical protein
MERENDRRPSSKLGLGGREGDVVGVVLLVRPAQVGADGLCGYTRARCYSSLKCLVAIGILHIKETGEEQ